MVDISDIKASIQSRSLIQNEFFRNADFLKDTRGRLITYTGGYSIVIPCYVNNEKWAFRCWHVPVKDAEKRYFHIGKKLCNTNLTFFSSFEYIEDGIIVKGNHLPITKMKWIDGANIKEYICNNFHNSKKIKMLATSFLDMIINLHSQNISHGDLQHGNIIVSKSEQLFLVDYDSMYVPEMKNNFPDIISGLIDYQHPARKQNKTSSEKLDYFSELIIYVSLLAVAEEPNLVSKYNLKDSESLLFKSSDFVNISESQIYKELNSLQNSEIEQCLKILEEYLSLNDINLLRPIESYLMSIDIDYPSVTPIKENFIINWKSHGVYCIEIAEIGEVDLEGSLNLNFSENKVICFNLYSKSGFKIQKSIEIKVAHRAIINHFKADKLYTYDNVPVILSWNCSYSNIVKLENYGILNPIGSISVSPKTETTYTLSVEDNFGIQTRTITIKMLPLPVINKIWIPTPKMNNITNIIYKTQKFNVYIPTPSFDNVLSRLTIPKIPQLRESSFFVTSVDTPRKSRVKQLIKTIYSIIKNISINENNRANRL